MGVGVEGDYSCLDCCFPVVFLLNHITGFALLSLQTINYLSHINLVESESRVPMHPYDVFF